MFKVGDYVTIISKDHTSLHFGGGHHLQGLVQDKGKYKLTYVSKDVLNIETHKLYPGFSIHPNDVILTKNIKLGKLYKVKTIHKYVWSKHD
ncbi:MAG: hypothetical protein COB41_00140 [Proteobacteria bacterium]|nr:MAG: hypothetical protein COB41_00140 [Pseudomonadota bacterium]